MNIAKRLSISNKSLRSRLTIAFSVMSVIPLLVLTYFTTVYIFEDGPGMLWAGIIVVLCSCLVWMGYIIIRGMLDPITELAKSSETIASGGYVPGMSVTSDDELGEIARAVNSMTSRMRAHMGELREYSERTSSLNEKIHRKVRTLTDLISLGELISTGAGFDNIAAFAAERLSGEMRAGFCAIFVKEDMSRYEMKAVADNSPKGLNLPGLQAGLPFIEELLLKHDHLIIDADPLKMPWQQELRQRLGRMSAIFFPIRVKASVAGLVICGTFEEDTAFTPDDVEVVRAFDSELVLAYLSKISSEKIRSLEIVDKDTGFYTFSFLRGRLDDEINRAIFYQRPCSLVIVDIDGFDEILPDRGKDKADEILRDVSRSLSELRPPIGKVARTGNGEFALLLPEMNKKESLEVGENIRSGIEKRSLVSGNRDLVTVSIGVGENPIDGATADEIFEKARSFAAEARERGGNRVAGGQR